MRSSNLTIGQEKEIKGIQIGKKKIGIPIHRWHCLPRKFQQIYQKETSRTNLSLARSRDTSSTQSYLYILLIYDYILI